MKKIKKEIPSNPVTKIKCPRCNKITRHMVIDEKNGIYKCLICKTIHA